MVNTVSCMESLVTPKSSLLLQLAMAEGEQWNTQADGCGMDFLDGMPSVCDLRFADDI